VIVSANDLQSLCRDRTLAGIMSCTSLRRSSVRRLALLLTIVATCAFADEKAKPNTLTPKEIAEGWILLFDGETTFGWTIEGDVKVKDGMLILGGEKATTARLNTCVSTDSTSIRYSQDGVLWGNSVHGLSDGKPIATFTIPKHVDWPFKLSYSDKESLFTLSVPAGKTAYLQSIMRWPGQTTPLFNAKDLTGWKEFKTSKEKKVASKFTVTKEGWLNVKDGPGDLQTEGQWADFVVQLECISNGKYLNSGLFFRAIPDLYQQGYEAQIRNEWTGDDRTKPVDFGTGAIYRRQAARKVVSTDGEWFTMTVAAHGRHTATWVNGYQVTDWTDDRKESDNGRNGYKKGKGALSIQGHDPTTDLSFRNIRIQSLDPK
jgi:Domain of Unknown Function (DUF1080)